MALWKKKNGALIAKANGSILGCDTCPCNITPPPGPLDPNGEDKRFLDVLDVRDSFGMQRANTFPVDSSSSQALADSSSDSVSTIILPKSVNFHHYYAQPDTYNYNLDFMSMIRPFDYNSLLVTIPFVKETSLLFKHSVVSGTSVNSYKDMTNVNNESLTLSISNAVTDGDFISAIVLNNTNNDKRAEIDNTIKIIPHLASATRDNAHDYSRDGLDNIAETYSYEKTTNKYITVFNTTLFDQKDIFVDKVIDASTLAYAVSKTNPLLLWLFNHIPTFYNLHGFGKALKNHIEVGHSFYMYANYEPDNELNEITGEFVAWKQSSKYYYNYIDINKKIAEVRLVKNMGRLYSGTISSLVYDHYHNALHKYNNIDYCDCYVTFDTASHAIRTVVSANLIEDFNTNSPISYEAYWNQLNHRFDYAILDSENDTITMSYVESFDRWDPNGSQNYTILCGTIALTYNNKIYQFYTVDDDWYCEEIENGVPVGLSEKHKLEKSNVTWYFYRKPFFAVLTGTSDYSKQLQQADGDLIRCYNDNPGGTAHTTTVTEVYNNLLSTLTVRDGYVILYSNRFYPIQYDTNTGYYFVDIYNTTRYVYNGTLSLMTEAGWPEPPPPPYWWSGSRGCPIFFTDYTITNRGGNSCSLVKKVYYDKTLGIGINDVSISHFFNTDTSFTDYVVSVKKRINNSNVNRLNPFISIENYGYLMQDEDLINEDWDNLTLAQIKNREYIKGIFTRIYKTGYNGQYTTESIWLNSIIAEAMYESTEPLDKTSYYTDLRQNALIFHYVKNSGDDYLIRSIRFTKPPKITNMKTTLSGQVYDVKYLELSGAKDWYILSGDDYLFWDNENDRYVLSPIQVNSNYYYTALPSTTYIEDEWINVYPLDGHYVGNYQGDLLDIRIRDTWNSFSALIGGVLRLVYTGGNESEFKYDDENNVTHDCTTTILNATQANPLSVHITDREFQGYGLTADLIRDGVTSTNVHLTWNRDMSFNDYNMYYDDSSRKLQLDYIPLDDATKVVIDNVYPTLQTNYGKVIDDVESVYEAIDNIHSLCCEILTGYNITDGTNRLRAFGTFQQVLNLGTEYTYTINPFNLSTLTSLDGGNFLTSYCQSNTPLSTFNELFIENVVLIRPICNSTTAGSNVDYAVAKYVKGSHPEIWNDTSKIRMIR